MPPSHESPPPLTSADSKQLVDLCQQGKLYEIEKWIAAGKSLQVSPECKTTPLQIAMERGFHSLVVLLTQSAVGQQAKNDALLRAVSTRNFEFIELLLKHGADFLSVPFSDVLLSWEPSLIRFFLERGADFITGAPFAKAFVAKVRTALRPFLECKQSHPEMAGELQKQADAALRYFCHAGNEKWVSLMLWAGADPRTEGPSPGDPDDLEYHTTALQQAGYKANVKILKLLKPQPDRDNVSELIRHSAMFGGMEAVSYLLQLDANLNDKPNGGSSALDGSLWNLGFDRVAPFYRKRQRPLYEVRASLDLIHKLVEHGALWRPDDNHALNTLRRTLFACEPGVTTELLKILRKHQACSEEVVHDLLRTSRMQQHLTPVESRLPRNSEKNLQKRSDGETKGATPPPGRKSSEPPSPSYQLLRRYNRDLLYDEVWKQPMWTLAKKYGISDVGLAKACRKLGVPLPGLGYWAKKAAGKKVPKRPPLPALAVARG
jgi:hypothetical protein